jgi:RNA-directed DNA polymerase
MVRTKKGQYFCGFTPAVSKSAEKSLQEKIRRLRRLTQLTIEELAEQVNPIIRGWVNYFGRFTASEVYKVLFRVNLSLARWVMKKYKRFRRRLAAALNWLGKVAATRPNLFAHWEMGMRPTAG